MNNLSCGVIQDLLPLYAEGLCGEESRAAVAAHVKDCDACRGQLDALKREVAPAPEATAVPVRKLAQKLKRQRLRLAVLVAALVCFAAVVVMNAITRPQLVPYQKDRLTVTQNEAGELAVNYMGTASVHTEWYEDTGDNGDEKHVTLFLTLYNDTPTQTMNTLMYPFRAERVYYAYPGREAVLLYGPPAEGGVTLLPRLVLNYYLLLAAGLAVLLAVSALLCRKHSKSRRGLLGALAFPVACMMAHLLIKGLNGASWQVMRDWTYILAAALCLVVALLTGGAMLRERRQLAGEKD